jgi:alpha-1,2-mannosyltransferase
MACPDEGRRGRWSSRRLLWAAAVVVVVFSVKGSFVHVFCSDVPIDFRSFYVASKGLLEQGNIYDSQYLDSLGRESGAPGRTFPYLYPPPLAFYLSPLTWLKLSYAAHVWHLLSAALCVVLVAQSMRLASVLPGRWPPPSAASLYLLTFGLFSVLPFANNLAQGQVNILVLTLIACALVQALACRRDALAGFLLAPAAWVKVTPAFLLLFLLLERRRRAVWGFLAGMVVFAAPTLLVKGGADQWRHFAEFLPQMSHGRTVPGLFPAATLPNFSMAGFLARLTDDPTLTQVLTYGVVLLLLALLVCRHWKRRGEPDAPLLLLPYLVLMVVASPLAYLHHVIYIYPALLAAAWLLVARGDRRSWVLLALAAGAALIASIDFPLYYRTLHVPPGVLQSLNLYALLVLFFLGLALPEHPAEPGRRG